MVETEVLQGHTSLDYTKESVKLTRNSKGYTWEIKIIGTEPNGVYSEADFKRLKDRNEEMMQLYGDTE